LAKKKKSKTGSFPTVVEIVDYLKSNQTRTSKRDIARAFNIKGADRVKLKALLRQMIDDGLIAKDVGKSLRPAGKLPGVSVVEVTGIDPLGDVTAKPQNWDFDDAPPRIFFESAGKRRGKALGKGDRALVHLDEKQDEDGSYYAARIIRVLGTGPATIMGVYSLGADGGRIKPSDRKIRDEFIVAKTDSMGAKDGALVIAEVIPQSRAGKRVYGLKHAKIIECLGDLSAPRAISLIAIHHHQIPIEFSPAALDEARAAKPVALGKRVDLRDIPLITIDPADARDHDDAIFAEPDESPDNKGGWHLIVAIADVAHYIRPGSALDIDARLRGNSCYFPDRVVPMLPEELSADLCSLKPGVERPVLAAHMWIDKTGRMLRHHFERAIMRSHANIAYGPAQLALEGVAVDIEPAMTERVLKPLYGAFKALMQARNYRQPLDLEIAENKIILDDQGHVIDVARRERLDTHRIVEEFMILANVAAAETLERAHVPCMYRVHEEPSLEKLEHLRNFLGSIGFRLAKAQVIKSQLFNNFIHKAKDTEFSDLVNDVVLRAQSQACYSPENRGHFGLALTRYAHFTSPIRRYSDLLVHRALVTALKLGDDGLAKEDILDMTQIGEAISATERRAMAAERESNDRYLAAFMADKIGAIMDGRISGVARFGLFVAINGTGADGIIPVSSLTSDFFDHDEAHHSLKGRRTGITYRLGDKVRARILDADRISGGLRLELIEGDATKSRRKSRSNKKASNKGRARKRSRHS
jgi:ribonuclease R